MRHALACLVLLLSARGCASSRSQVPQVLPTPVELVLLDTRPTTAHVDSTRCVRVEVATTPALESQHGELDPIGVSRPFAPSELRVLLETLGNELRPRGASVVTLHGHERARFAVMREGVELGSLDLTPRWSSDAAVLELEIGLRTGSKLETTSATLPDGGTVWITPRDLADCCWILVTARVVSLRDG